MGVIRPERGISVYKPIYRSWSTSVWRNISLMREMLRHAIIQRFAESRNESDRIA